LRQTKEKQLFEGGVSILNLFFPSNNKISTIWAIVDEKQILVIRGKDSKESMPPPNNRLPAAVQHYLHYAGALLFLSTFRAQFQFGERISYRSKGHLLRDNIEVHELCD
jgi:hypothetical protein